MLTDLPAYGFTLLDVLAGEVPSGLVLEVIAGLPLGSRTVSMMAAEKSGGSWEEWYGKDRHWFIMADLIDAVNNNTQASGNWRKVPKAPKPYPRPGMGRKKKRSFMEFYADMTTKWG